MLSNSTNSITIGRSKQCLICRFLDFVKNVTSCHILDLTQSVITNKMTICVNDDESTLISPFNRHTPTKFLFSLFFVYMTKGDHFISRETKVSKNTMGQNPRELFSPIG